MENHFAISLKFAFPLFQPVPLERFLLYSNFHFLSNHNGSLFLAHHDQDFIMFKYSNVFEFTKFLFKRKYNNTVVYSASSNYLFSRGKQENKLLKQFLD